jgi:hypothetical protein
LLTSCLLLRLSAVARLSPLLLDLGTASLLLPTFAAAPALPLLPCLHGAPQSSLLAALLLLRLRAASLLSPLCGSPLLLLLLHLCSFASGSLLAPLPAASRLLRMLDLSTRTA